MTAAFLFVGLLLLWIVASGKALAVWRAITAAPGQNTAQVPDPTAAS